MDYQAGSPLLEEIFGGAYLTPVGTVAPRDWRWGKCGESVPQNSKMHNMRTVVDILASVVVGLYL